MTVPREMITHVRVTPELLAVLTDDWSEPVQIAFAQLNGQWTMIFRTHTCTIVSTGEDYAHEDSCRCYDCRPGLHED